MEFFREKYNFTQYDLSFWEKLKSQNLSDQDLKKLISDSKFFFSPKENAQIQKQHSILIDSILKFPITKCEDKLQAEAKAKWNDKRKVPTHFSLGPSLHQGIQTWVGVDPQTLNTPYSVLLNILLLLNLKNDDHIIDLGAAYGRMGIVLASISKEVFYTGIEYANERVKLGAAVFKRLGLNRSTLLCADVTRKDFAFSNSNIFFIYDYGKLSDIHQTLVSLLQISNRKEIKVVARGPQTLDMINNKFQWDEVCNGRGLDFKIYRLSP